ncbi:MAG: aminotransferase class V-fold PLP-dependent enzyme, partial [Alphaproteobacteria bacterium]|nr:aminotransferase class V-fold PLP-dependent enzyme [Alphaproteobacteria bacterium]
GQGEVRTALNGDEHALRAGDDVSLGQRNSARLLGPAQARLRAPTVAVALAEPGEAAARRLAAHGIVCDGGDFYAQRPLQAMGIDMERGVLRMSFVHYTTSAEVDRLIAALDHEL